MAREYWQWVGLRHSAVGSTTPSGVYMHEEGGAKLVLCRIKHPCGEKHTFEDRWVTGAAGKPDHFLPPLPLGGFRGAPKPGGGISPEMPPQGEVWECQCPGVTG